MQPSRLRTCLSALYRRSLLFPGQRRGIVSDTSVVNVAMLGAGRMGRFHGISLTQHVSKARVVAVVDTDIRFAQRLADDLAVGVASDDPASVIARDDVDAVIVATPQGTHLEMIKLAVQHDKHIFCEKPLAASQEEGRIVEELMRDYRKVFQLGFCRRFDPEYLALRAAVQAGDVGTPHLIRLTSYDGMRAPIDYYRHSGGLFKDMQTHDLDMISFLADSPIVSVQATGRINLNPVIREWNDVDTCVTVLHFANGMIGTIENHRYATYGHDVRAEVVGSRGRVQIGPAMSSTLVKADQSGYKQGVLTEHMARFEPTFTTELQAFVQAVRSGKLSPVAPSWKDGINNLHVVSKCEESLAERKAVDVTPLFGIGKPSVQVGVTAWTLDDGSGKAHGVEALAMARDLGFSAIQIDSGAGGWRGFPDITSSPDVLEAYRQESERTGVKIVGLAANITIEGPENQCASKLGWPRARGVSALVEPDSVEAQLCRTYYEQTIVAASKLGVSCVFLPFFFASRIETELDLSRAGLMLNHLVVFARDYGVTVSLESTLGVDWTLRLLEMAPGCRVLFDGQNPYLFGHPSSADIARGLSDHCCNQWHAKDGSHRFDENSKLLLFPSMGNTALGCGDANMQATMNVFRERRTPFDYVISECCYNVNDPEHRNNALKDLDFLGRWYDIS